VRVDSVPEGDTVWRAARLLDHALSAKVLTRTDVRVPAYATWDLAGATVTETVSRGKHLLTRIDGDRPWTLHTHLKMEVGFQLGIVEIVPRAGEADVVGHLGPDLLGPDWDADEAVSRLREHADRTVKAALLDQTRLAGIGNMYANELCFVSGISPETPIDQVPDLHRLVLRAHQMLDLNRQRAQQSTTGDLARGRQFWVYNRAGEPCRRCGTAIVRSMLGPDGEERTTFACPRCQA
jgi:endonuclease-8